MSLSGEGYRGQKNTKHRLIYKTMIESNFLEDKSKRTRYYSNGIVKKYHNKKIMLRKHDKADVFLFDSITYNNSPFEKGDEPIHFTRERDCINVTSVIISRETLEAFILCGMDMLSRFPEKTKEVQDEIIS